MAGEWSTGRLSDIAEIVMGQSPSGKKCNSHGRGLPLLNGPTEFGSHHPSPVQFTTDPKKVAVPGDILFCVRGSTTGRMNWSNQQYAIGRGIAAMHHVNGIEYQPFLRGLMENSLPSLLLSATGSTFPNVNRDQLLGLAIRIPPLPEQRAIAHILGSLDDKIELNRKMNETLEAMAQALFKSWFVDFDPVIDNALAAGNPIPEELAEKATLRESLGDAHKPLPGEIRRLFPDEFVKTKEMGWIPKGWKVASLSNIAALNPESWTTKTAPTQLLYVDLANTKNGRINLIVPYQFVNAPSRARRVLQRDDTVIGTVRPANRSFAYIHDDGLTGSTGFAVMRPLEECFRAFVYLCLTRNEVIDYFAQLADGGAYPAIRPEIVCDFRCVQPVKELFVHFEKFTAPWIRGIGERETAIVSLSMLRDTLLSKLISGEIRISDAEQYM